MLAEGASYREIAREVGCSSKYVALWKRRFQESRLAGLDSRYQGRRAWVVTPKLEAKVIARTRQARPDRSTHWSSRELSQGQFCPYRDRRLLLPCTHGSTSTGHFRPERSRLSSAEVQHGTGQSPVACSGVLGGPARVLLPAAATTYPGRA